MAIDSGTTERRSRRAILAGALGGVAGLIAGRFGTADSAEAASGDPLILGLQTNNSGTTGTKLSTAGTDTGLYVQQNGTGTALRGLASNGIAGFFTSSNGTGVSGVTAKDNQFGVYGANDALTNGGGEAIRANGQQNHGLVGTSANASAYGVKAINTGYSGTALYGQAVSGYGYAVYGAGDTRAMYANAAAATGDTFAVIGSAASTTGTGVVGTAAATTGITFGVYGYVYSPSGTAVIGKNVSGTGGTYGVYGSVVSPDGYAVVGIASATSGVNYGVYGLTESPTGYGVYSWGDAHVQGDLDVTGAIVAGTKDFKIDHPLDPAQKFLSHSCVESDDRRTVYDGEVTLDATGEATVVLPAWFGALNGKTRIQLTPIGPGAPDLHVKSEVADNRFAIGGGASDQKIYWHLSAVRQDPYAKAHPLAVEAAKTGTEKGRYLHPEVYGKPASKSIDALHARPVLPTGH